MENLAFCFEKIKNDQKLESVNLNTIKGIDIKDKV